MNKVISRIKGGLGNQLSAMPLRVAWPWSTELVIDDVTGFARDRKYRCQYRLDRLIIPARKATQGGRLEPSKR